VEVEVEEVPRPSAPVPPEFFYIDYLPLRMDDASLIIVPSNAKYPLPIAPVPKGVRKDEDMLNKVGNLKFMDHDITDMQKFPKLAKDQYLCTKAYPTIGKTRVEAHE
jgi:hypothetical protein